MSLNAKAMLVALVPNTMFVCVLAGWMAGRLSSGESPFPQVTWPFVLPLIVTVPLVCAAAGNAVRLSGRRA